MLNTILVVLVVWAVPLALILLRMNIYARAMMRTAPTADHPASQPRRPSGIDWDALESELASRVAQRPVVEVPASFDLSQAADVCPLHATHDPCLDSETLRLN